MKKVMNIYYETIYNIIKILTSILTSLKRVNLRLKIRQMKISKLGVNV